MMNRGVVFAVALSASALAQRPQFDVASIKMYPAGASRPPGGNNGFKVAPDGVAARYTRFWAALAWAYDIPGSVFGPDWVTDDRFDIVAKAAGPVPESQLRLMVQNLLENRFQLKLHREMRDLPVAVMEIAKSGPKNLSVVQTADPERYEPAGGVIVFRNGTLTKFAAFLGNSPPYGIREKVVDRTGLDGRFDLTLNVKGFDPGDAAFAGNYDEMQSAAFAFVSNALERQYGLKLSHRKLALECLVVDSGNRVPSEN